jgi:hypothetical protein
MFYPTLLVGVLIIELSCNIAIQLFYYIKVPLNAKWEKGRRIVYLFQMFKKNS